MLCLNLLNYNMAHHNTTGKLGEEMASEYLLQKGFAILHKNWRYSHWEVDIISERHPAFY